MTFGEEEPAISQKEEPSQKRYSDFGSKFSVVQKIDEENPPSKKSLAEKIAELSLDKPPIMEIPSNVQEFQNCDSHYQIPEKEHSYEISSDGEFEDANHILLLNDDCTEVLEIDVQKEMEKQGVECAPDYM